MDILGLSASTWALITTGAGLAFYLYYRHKYSYFKDHGIPGPTPIPLLGTAYKIFTQGLIEHDLGIRDKYGKVAGLYEGSSRILLISDEDMLREILVKDFDSFKNHKSFGAFGDEIFDNMMTMLKDDDWKRVRSLLTPTFSTGKLKLVCQGVNVCGAQLAENLGQMADSGEEIEMKEYCGNFAMDVIARTAFGIEVNSMKDKNNDFVKYGKKLFDFKLTNPLIILSVLFPSLLPVATKLGLRLFDKAAMNFFTGIVEQAMEGRSKGDKSYNDLLQLMTNAHTDEFDADEVAKELADEGIEFDKETKQKKGLSKAEIIAQGIVFILGGYENIANSIALLFYCLAIHPECQAKAQEEVDRLLDDKDEVSYSDAQSLTYLDQCYQESLRIYTLAARADRECNRDTVIKGISIPKGTVIGVSIIARHMDPEIWPEPEKYDPDRFSPEERAKHSPFDHMPFGYGPRNCIATRLALMEAKISVALVLKSFTVKTCERTQIPLKFQKMGVSKTEKGIWLKFDRR